MIMPLIRMLATEREVAEFLIICILKVECTTFTDGFDVRFMKKRN